MLGNLPRQASNCLGYTSRRHFLGVTAAFAAVPAIAEATEASATLRQVRRIAHSDGPLYYETMGGWPRYGLYPSQSYGPILLAVSDGSPIDVVPLHRH